MGDKLHVDHGKMYTPIHALSTQKHWWEQKVEVLHQVHSTSSKIQRKTLFRLSNDYQPYG